MAESIRKYQRVYKPGIYFILLCSGLSLGATLCQGQDALRSAVATDRSTEARRAASLIPPDDQIRIGRVSISAGLSYSLELTDNVRTSETGAGEEMIHRPAVNFGFYFPFTLQSRLSFSAGVGYAKYVKNPDLDRVFITPGSELAWDIAAKDTVFTLFDRFSYSQDVVSEPSLSGEAAVPRFNNTVGLRVSYSPNRFSYQAGYSHENVFSDTSEFDYLNRASEQFFGRIGYLLSPEAQTGIEASSSLAEYDADVQRDNRSISFGPFIDMPLGNSVRASLRGGLVYYRFDSGGLAGESSYLRSYYVGAELDHSINQFVSHSLSIERSVQPGLNRGSEYTEESSAAYGISWQATDDATVRLALSYTKGTQPSTPLAGGIPVPDEEYEQVNVGPAIGYRLTERLRASVSYRLSVRKSELSDRDYTRNSVIMTVNYGF